MDGEIWRWIPCTCTTSGRKSCSRRAKRRRGLPIPEHRARGRAPSRRRQRRVHADLEIWHEVVGPRRRVVLGVLRGEVGDLMSGRLEPCISSNMTRSRPARRYQNLLATRCAGPPSLLLADEPLVGTRAGRRRMLHCISGVQWFGWSPFSGTCGDAAWSGERGRSRAGGAPRLEGHFGGQGMHRPRWVGALARSRRRRRVELSLVVVEAQSGAAGTSSQNPLGRWRAYRTRRPASWPSRRAGTTGSRGGSTDLARLGCPVAPPSCADAVGCGDRCVGRRCPTCVGGARQTADLVVRSRWS